LYGAEGRDRQKECAMFAVIKTGGKQYKVAANDILKIEKLAADAGDTIQFNDILMLGGETVTVGAPLVAGAAVQAEVVEQTRGEKTISFKKRRRKHSSARRKGHRQYLTVVRITGILESGADATGVKAAVGARSAPAVVAEAPAAAKKTVVRRPAQKKAAAAATAE
jgi:large subunit ribosomal protein L21